MSNPKKTSENPGLSGVDRRSFLKISALATAGMLAPTACKSLFGSRRAGSKSGKRPNIVFFLTDDQVFDGIGYAANGAVQTPCLDRLAARGMIFNNAYCNSIPCIPSRACIMSGLHDHRYERQRVGLLDGLKEGSWTWAHALAEAGYQTALIGKMHFQPLRSNHGFQYNRYCENKLSFEIREENDAFDDYYLWLEREGVVRLNNRQPRGGLSEDLKYIIPEEPGRPALSWKYDEKYHPISYVRDQAIQYLQNQQDDAPHVLLVSFRFPHSPYIPAQPFDTMYNPADVPDPTEAWEDMKNIPDEVIEAGNKRLFGIIPTWDHRGRQWYREMVCAYRGLISQMDAAIADIMKHIDLDDTMVLYTSDHGDFMGARGRVFKSPLIPFDPIARVPFFAAGYGVPQGTVCDRDVSLADIAPTFLQAAGLPAPADLDGTPLQNYFRNPNHEAERPVFCHGEDGFDMVRRGDWKYFRGNRGDSEMLFNLNKDPREMNNIVREPDARTPLRNISKEMDRVFDKPPAQLPAFAVANDPAPA